MTASDGDGWTRCQLGHRHWGRYGAAGLLVHSAGLVLLQRRAWWTHHGGTWSIPGGAMNSGESAESAAFREAAEECGLVDCFAIAPVISGEAGERALADLTVTRTITDDHGNWAYHTVIAWSSEAFAVRANAETAAAEWVAIPAVDLLNLHPGFAVMWPELREAITDVR